MCMANPEIVEKVQELQELRRTIEELQAEAEALQDQIKAYMGNDEQITAGLFKVRYQLVTSSRFDANEKELDIFINFTKEGDKDA